MPIDDDIALEILRASQQEHFKALKDMAFYLPVDHPRRVKMTEENNAMVDKIQDILNRR